MDKGHGQKEPVFQGVSKALDWAHPDLGLRYVTHPGAQKMI